MATDSDIFSAICRDPEKGFGLLVQQYSERVYWHVRRTVGCHADAQDATQEAFIRIFRSLGSLRDVGALKSWVYRIATNEALRLLENRQRGGDTLPLSGAEAVEGDAYVDYSDALAVELKRAIDSLPPKQRMTFNLRYYDELEYEEIAAVLGSSVQSARANYHNAKEKIINYMNSINLHI